MYDARPSFRSSSNRKPLNGCACIRSHKHTSRARSTHTIGRSDKLSENHYSFLRMEIASSSQKTSPACVFLFNAVDPSPPERHSQAQRARRTPSKNRHCYMKKDRFQKRSSSYVVNYTVNAALPFALLAASTFLPPAVAILALNP